MESLETEELLVSLWTVNYQGNHNSNCFQIFNPKTGKIIESRDIQWLNQMFYNTNIIRTTFPKITLHWSHEQIPVNDQTLLPNDEAMEDEIALDEVT